MATTGVFNGNILGIYVGGTLILCATSESFELTNAEIDATCKDNSGARQVLMGQQSWSMSFEGLTKYDAAYGIEDLRTLALNKTSATFRWSTEVTGDTYMEGTGYISSFSENAGVNEVATYSISITGTGSISSGTVA